MAVALDMVVPDAGGSEATTHELDINDACQGVWLSHWAYKTWNSTSLDHKGCFQPLDDAHIFQAKMLSRAADMLGLIRHSSRTFPD